jgi:hypothetical protein
MEVTCQECGGILQDLAALMIHMENTHNKHAVLICKICHEKCIGNDDFDRHLQFTHGTKHWSLNLVLKQTKRDIEKMGTGV